jgi:hypothetical protein
MSSDLRRTVRVLQGYVAALTVAVAILAVVGLRRTSGGMQRFTEIDAQRINVVEPDGTIRLVLSDQARFPGLILKRKEYSHPRGVAGLLFFNDDGTEDGGLAYRGFRHDSGTVADGELMFDQYGQDQTVGIEYSDEAGKRLAGLHVWDRPDSLPIDQLIARAQAIRSMPEGPDRAEALRQLKAATGATRLFAGKTPDHSTIVALSDPEGRVRLRMVVDTSGDGRIEFLDATGRVTTTVRPH